MRVLLCALLVLCAAVAAPISNAVTGRTPSTRTITFPARGLGKYYIEDARRSFLSQWPAFAKRSIAKGRVSVPADASIAVETYFCNHDCLPDLRFLRPNDIQTLDVDGSILKHSSFKYISRLTGLKTLTLDGTDTDDKDIEFLSVGMPSLQTLNLGYTKITDRALVSISKMKSIKALSFQNNAVTPVGLKSIVQNSTLCELDLKDTALGDDAIRVLSKARSLSVLNLAKTKITDRGLLSLRSLRSIRKLDLSGTCVTDAAVANSISRLENLEELNLSGTRITDAGVAQLSKLKNLKKLWLRDLKKVSDSSVPALISLTNLVDLELQKTNITAKGVQLIAKALPESEVHSKALCSCRTRTRVN